jgi:hypothetical protein
MGGTWGRGGVKDTNIATVQLYSFIALRVSSSTCLDIQESSKATATIPHTHASI